MLGSRDIALAFRTPEDDPLLSAELRRHFLLIAKEAVNNVARHSGATQAAIEFELQDNRIFLRVYDNGRGFDPALGYQGNGLGNMRRRALMLGGRVDLMTFPGGGTRIVASAPLRG